MQAIFTFLKNGGPIMVPLILASVLMLAILFERAIVLNRSRADGDDLLQRVRDALSNGSGPAGARKAMEGEKTSLARVFSRGLKNADRPAEAIEMAMELEASTEIQLLEANLVVVKTIINIAPLLGLLGTIMGMIQAFEAASKAGLSNPNQILGGISEALVSTATGIVIAVIGFLGYNTFANQSRKIIEDIEYYGAELVNLLTGRID